MRGQYVIKREKKLTIKEEVQGNLVFFDQHERRVGFVLYQSVLPSSTNIFLDKPQLDTLKWFDASSIYVEKVFIFNHSRGKGYLKVILKLMEEYFSTKGKTSIVLIPSVLPDRFERRSDTKRWESLISSYRKAGYGIMTAYYSEVSI